MRILPRSTRVRLIAAVAAVATAVAGGVLWLNRDSLPDDAAFAVGERVVSVDELEQRVDTFRALYGIEIPAGGAELDRFRRDSAKAVAVSIVLDDAAARENVVIADKAARDVLDRYLAEQFGGGADARSRFVQALGNAGTTEQAVLTEVKRRLATTRLHEQVTRGITVSEQDLRTAFAERKAELGTPERRALRNIVVADEDEAKRVVAQLADGEDFADLARKVSLDDATRAEGGTLGEIGRDQLEAEYAEVAFAAKQGQVFGPVRTEFGWNVGRVDTSLPARPAEWDAVRGTLEKILILERGTERWRAWVRDQISAADVRYAEQYRPADPGQAPDPGSPAMLPRSGK